MKLNMKKKLPFFPPTPTLGPWGTVFLMTLNIIFVGGISQGAWGQINILLVYSNVFADRGTLPERTLYISDLFTVIGCTMFFSGLVTGWLLDKFGNYLLILVAFTANLTGLVMMVVASYQLISVKWYWDIATALLGFSASCTIFSSMDSSMRVNERWRTWTSTLFGCMVMFLSLPFYPIARHPLEVNLQKFLLYWTAGIVVLGVLNVFLVDKRERLSEILHSGLSLRGTSAMASAEEGGGGPKQAKRKYKESECYSYLHKIVLSSSDIEYDIEKTHDIKGRQGYAKLEGDSSVDTVELTGKKYSVIKLIQLACILFPLNFTGSGAILYSSRILYVSDIDFTDNITMGLGIYAIVGGIIHGYIMELFFPWSCWLSALYCGCGTAFSLYTLNHDVSKTALWTGAVVGIFSIPVVTGIRFRLARYCAPSKEGLIAGIAYFFAGCFVLTVHFLMKHEDYVDNVIKYFMYGSGGGIILGVTITVILEIIRIIKKKTLLKENRLIVNGGGTVVSMYE